MDDLILRAGQVAATSAPRLKARTIARRVAASKRNAAPGPSGWKNTYLALIMAAKGGPQALLAWSQAWANGAVSPHLARLWTAALVRPFFKSNGVDVRPVLCSEALVKLALGSAVDAAHDKVMEAMGACQYGGGRKGGAHLEVEQIRAASGKDPSKAFVSLDVANAFGAVQWADALEAVIDRAPGLAPALAAQWAPRAITLFTQQRDGTWQPMMVYGASFRAAAMGTLASA